MNMLSKKIWINTFSSWWVGEYEPGPGFSFLLISFNFCCIENLGDEGIFEVFGLTLTYAAGPGDLSLSVVLCLGLSEYEG